jgi:hypothetical protein
MKANPKKRRWMKYAGPWSSPTAAYSLYIIATLLQVPDGLMAAYESQSEEEELDEIYIALRCAQPEYIGDTIEGA